MMSLIITIAVLILSGWMFALPALIPTLRNQAWASSKFRKWLGSFLSLFTFCVFFFGLSYANAAITTSFWDVTTPLCGGEGCSNNSSAFGADNHRNFLITLELWLDNIVPPFIVLDQHCFVQDTLVCELADEIPTNDSTLDYFRSLTILSIPAISCSLIVRYLTRDDRKQKGTYPQKSKSSHMAKS